MNFWELATSSDRLALIDESTGRRWTYGELREKADAFATLVSAPKKRLGFLLCKNVPECIAAYLGCLRSKTAVALLGAELPPELLSALVREYRPSWVMAPTECKPLDEHSPHPFSSSYICWTSARDLEVEIFSRLALLLSTSGSTGSPKFVRLSYSNLQANAQSISQYLHLNYEERPITSLPMQYSYGLSVINSHLLSGATILVTDRSIMEKRFWDFAATEKASSLSGVPYMYQMALRTGFLKLHIRSLRTLTQAGGALAPKLIQQVHSLSLTQSRSFYVMYGQTEATARISYVPPETLSDNVGAIGIPVPGGKMHLDAESGEIIYTGPNVMLGYAQRNDDLSRGDEMNGVLHTGDLGRQNNAGLFYVTGRMKRFLKIFGQRFSLDEVERTLGERFDGPIACFGRDDLLCVGMEGCSEVDQVAKFVQEFYQVHHSAVKVWAFERLPRNANGKIDYSALRMPI